MVTEQELNGLKQQLAEIDSDLQLYSEEEHIQVESLRAALRQLIANHGVQAELAIVATTLEISIKKALS